jgi:hypothetical protein
VVQRVPPSSTRPIRWRRVDPEEGVVEYCPVFTSREDAEVFVLAAGYPSAYEVAIDPQGEEQRTESPQLQQMLADVRPLERSEIPLDHRVLRNPVYGQGGPAFVTWEELLAEGE